MHLILAVVILASALWTQRVDYFGVKYLWPSHTINYNFSPHTSRLMEKATQKEFAEIEANCGLHFVLDKKLAFGSDETGILIQESPVKMFDEFNRYYPVARNVYWMNAPSPGLCVVAFNTRVYEFHSGEPFRVRRPGRKDSYSVDGVMRHELIGALCFGYALTMESCMSAFATNGEEKMKLWPTDVEGLQTLYGTTAP